MLAGKSFVDKQWHEAILIRMGVEQCKFLMIKHHVFVVIKIDEDTGRFFVVRMLEQINFMNNPGLPCCRKPERGLLEPCFTEPSDPSVPSVENSDRPKLLPSKDFGGLSSTDESSFLPKETLARALETVRSAGAVCSGNPDLPFFDRFGHSGKKTQV